MTNTKEVDKKEVIAYLDTLGMQHAVKGFEYVTEAIHGRLHGKYTGGMINMYSDIARMYDTKPTRVERAIRYAVVQTNAKITNSEFIAKGVNNLKYQ